MASELVVLTPEQLEELVRRAVSEVVAELPASDRAPALVDRAGLARELSCSPSTVDALRRKGIPEIRIGDAPRFETARVVEWLRQRGRV